MNKMNELKMWTPNPAALRTMGIRNPLTAGLNQKLTKEKWHGDIKAWLYKVELPCLEGTFTYTYMLPDEIQKNRITYGKLAWKMEHALMTWARQRKTLKLKDTISELLKGCGYTPGKKGFDGRLLQQVKNILFTWATARLIYDGYTTDKKWRYHLTWITLFAKDVKLLTKEKKGTGKDRIIGFAIELNEELCGKPAELQWVNVPCNYLEGLTNIEAYIFNYIYSLQGLPSNPIIVKTLLNRYCLMPDELITKRGSKEIKKWVDNALEKGLCRNTNTKRRVTIYNGKLNWGCL